MPTTEIAALPLLVPGQLAKEETHNEALVRLDFLVAGRMAEVELTEPPETPEGGVLYRISANPQGAFVGKAGSLAGWTPNGWRFFTPFEGYTLPDVSDGTAWTYVDAQWEKGSIRANALLVNGKQVVSSRRAPIAAPAGGSINDFEARQAIGAILNALREHGLIET